MKVMRNALILGLVAILLVTGCKQKKEKNTSAQGKSQTMCPVMNQPIKKEFFADYQGKRIYFCHDYCVEAFKKTPDKYMKKMQEEGITLEDAPAGSAAPPVAAPSPGGAESHAATTPEAKPQTLCPVMDMPIDKKYFADYNGKRIYFCHDGCVQEFGKDPEKYMKKLQEQGVTLENTPSP
jgi:YHS domain-containing protein